MELIQLQILHLKLILTVENIGARRLHTIIERVLDEISFTATDRAGEKSRN